MASVYKQSGGRYAIQIGTGTNRRVRRLGKLTRAGAAALQLHADMIEVCRKTATILPPSTVAWLATVGDELHAKLAQVGLVPAREAPAPTVADELTIGNLWDLHLERRPDLRPFTRSNLVQTKLRCVEYFGFEPITRITTGDAKDFRRHLATKYATATVSGFIGKTRQLFNDAIDRGLVTRNPFRGVGGGSQVNVERRHYVTRETIEKVMAAAPNDEWRLLIALGRYVGARVPSEVAGIRIDDVDFAQGRIIIRSPKTAAQGKPSRIVPLWPELAPLLHRVISAARPGQEKLLPFVRPDYNPHTNFLRIIRRAGVETWPKLWQNLRSTRETELLAQGFPLHVVCAWIGNSERVASRHYLQVTEADFAKAIGGAAQSAALPSGSLGQLGQDNHPAPRLPHYQPTNAVLPVDPVPLVGVEQAAGSRRVFSPSDSGAAKSAAFELKPLAERVHSRIDVRRYFAELTASHTGPPDALSRRGTG
jgi:integrase